MIEIKVCGGEIKGHLEGGAAEVMTELTLGVLRALEGVAETTDEPIGQTFNTFVRGLNRGIYETEKEREEKQTQNT